MTTGSAGDGEAHEKRIALRVENGGSAYEASAGWPRPAERGVIPIDGPGGQALQFTTGYAIYDGIAPAGSGAIWTVAFWLRPDEPDWGIWQVPWSSTRDPKTMFRFSHPTVMHLGTFLTHLWEVHLCRNHLELQVGDWRAWSTAEIEVGRWTHVAIVRDGDTLKLYLDGKADALQPPDMLDAPPARCSVSRIRQCCRRSQALRCNFIPPTARSTPAFFPYWWWAAHMTARVIKINSSEPSGI